MIDLSTRYLGLTLRNPLVVSASPLGEDLVRIVDMEEAGAAAIVLPSLFEEQLSLEGEYLDQSLSAGAESFAEARTYLPELGDYNLGPEGYIEHIRECKAAVRIPIIASLNGVTPGSWIHYGLEMQEAGADALELNIYYLPNSVYESGAEVEDRYIDLVRQVKASVRIPVAVKLGPYFSSTAHMARQLDQGGADALVLFNRFYQPDFDLDNLEVRPSLTLSTPEELRLRLHWVAVLYGRLRCDLAITGGVHSATDVLKSMMAGAKVAMMTSALLRRGVEHMRHVLRDLEEWMKERDYQSIRQMQGSMSRQAAARPEAFERANYLKVLSSYTFEKARFGGRGPD
jgi:dihydroorotate dehydrogenase (fumarate)